MKRRRFLSQSLAGAAGALVAARFTRAAAALSASRKPTDIRAERVEISFEDHLYRSPVKFAGALMDRATILNVECRGAINDGLLRTSELNGAGLGA